MKVTLGITVFHLMAAGSFAASSGIRDETRLGIVKTPIDTAQKYYLGWSVDKDSEKITFEIEAQTKGYVGFGISPNGAMTGADLFIAGVNDDGTTYSGDYYGTKNGMPSLDEKQDWTLIDASENDTHTILKFSRSLDTCDENDFAINGDTSRVIWSLGKSDDLEHHAERGTVSANFLIPEQAFNPADYASFTTMADMVMPAQDTSYWCSFHKGPVFDQKNHIIAFEANLPTTEAEEYTHHFILYGCKAPPDQDADEFFQKFVGSEGGHCYGDDRDSIPFFDYCARQMIFVWAKGGKRMVFPENVGYPVGETPGESMYFMLEVHYDNPKLVEGARFSTGVRTFHTTTLRDIEAALMIVGYSTDSSLIVPPKTKDYIVAGHCSPECTKANFPEDGITIFNALLHAHMSGRQLKLRQFRNGEELPWLDHDDHYDFNFQQNKPLTNFVKVLPGDQLTYECNYDSTWNEKGEAVIGGFSSRDEMCETFLWYYPKTDLAGCASSYPLAKGYYEEFGITKYHEVMKGGIPTIEIDEPEELKGSYVDAISFKINWTDQYLKDFQNTRRYEEHRFTCVGMNGTIKYPEIKHEYVPEDKCSNNAGARIMWANCLSVIVVANLVLNPSKNLLHYTK